MSPDKLVKRHEFNDETRELEKPRAHKMVWHVASHDVTAIINQHYRTGGIWYDWERGWWCIVQSIVDQAHAMSHTSYRTFKLNRRVRVVAA